MRIALCDLWTVSACCTRNDTAFVLCNSKSVGGFSLTSGAGLLHGDLCLRSKRGELTSVFHMLSILQELSLLQELSILQEVELKECSGLRRSITALSHVS